MQAVLQIVQIVVMVLGVLAAVAGALLSARFVLRQVGLLQRSLRAQVYNTIVNQSIEVKRLLLGEPPSPILGTIYDRHRPDLAKDAVDNRSRVSKIEISGRRALIEKWEQGVNLGEKVRAMVVLDHYENVLLHDGLEPLPGGVGTQWKNFIWDNVWGCPVLTAQWLRMEATMAGPLQRLLAGARPGSPLDGDAQKTTRDGAPIKRADDH